MITWQLNIGCIKCKGSKNTPNHKLLKLFDRKNLSIYAYSPTGFYILQLIGAIFKVAEFKGGVYEIGLITGLSLHDTLKHLATAVFT